MSARVPTATYRIQFNKRFRFQDAADLVPYLADLGVSDLYASPILRAVSGSDHGYDVADATHVDPDRGGEEGLRRLGETLRGRGMGLIVDIVPNHMAAHPENPWWADVLRHGPNSRYARHFDIDWESRDEALRGKVLLPVVDGDPERLLAEGRIRPVVADDAVAIDVDGLRLPVAPETEDEAVRLAGDRPTDADAVRTLLARQNFVLADWRSAPDRVNYRRFFDINHLVSMRAEDPAVFADMHATILHLVRRGLVTGLRIDHIDGLADPRGYLERLQEALRHATEAAPPGRTIATVESTETWVQSDGTLLMGSDEPSGSASETTAALSRPNAVVGSRLPFYVAVEKILVGPERLPPDWPVHGATGYESAAAIEGLFVDATGLERLERVYSGFIDDQRVFSEVVYEAKKEVIAGHFRGLFHDLAVRLDALLDAVPEAPRPEVSALRDALSEAAATFPVYRTYAEDGVFSEHDRAITRRALQETQRRRGDLVDAVRALEAFLLPSDPQSACQDVAGRNDWVRRWQQATGPVMAKGYEDTALYRHYGLISLNEVGDRPDRAMWVETFHDLMTERMRSNPDALNASSTHDSKRSEDVRARLHALSEMPDAWATRIGRWAQMNEGLKTVVEGRPRPGRDMEYLLYETLVGAWPIDGGPMEGFADRIVAYMRKAAREAKRATRWDAPDADYEQALASFIRAILVSDQGAPFRADLQNFLNEVAPLGAVNSLASLTLKCTTPGIPDIYQGQESWDQSLVDPDNRRPVDFKQRREHLEALRAATQDEGMAALAAHLLEHWDDGRLKLHVTDRLLDLRRERPRLFARGEYLPARTQGRWGRHVVAFTRHYDGRWALVVVPRSTRVVATGRLALGDRWQDTEVVLPPGAPSRWVDRFTGRVVSCAGGATPIPVAELFGTLPIAVLTEAKD